MRMERYLEMLRKYPVFEEGKSIYDVPYVARLWKENGFSIDEAEEWVKAGAYLANHAVELKELKLTPGDITHGVEMTATFAQWWCLSGS